MHLRSLAGLAVLAAGLVALSGCTAQAPTPAPTNTITTPQASITGEWIVTRTVTASDDASTPSRAVGAESTRLVLIEQPDCTTAPCAGTVSSGSTLDGRESTPLEQIDGGLRWAFDGALDCVRAESDSVLVVDAFTYRQTAQLMVTEREDVDGTDTATRLEGEIDYTDSLTTAGIDGGCLRDPITVTVSYAAVAVRSTGQAPPADEG